ncbi:hypothetical protein [uncultured Bifidobacterium sp.]|uniref:hypothetical protein n=1 Tax=uncultured Bifidobacterium sp. TaxID=165187 RepID=UPI00258E506D|nr:hypothetical protein [uncultured Bifidobacterium sp.]
MPGYEQSTGLFVMGVLSSAQNAVPSAGAQYGAPGYEQSAGLFVRGVLGKAQSTVEDPGIAGVFPYRVGITAAAMHSGYGSAPIGALVLISHPAYCRGAGGIVQPSRS